MIAGDYEFRAKGSRYALDQQIKTMNLSRALETLSATGLPPGELHIQFWIKLYEALGFEDKEKVEKELRTEIAQFKAQQQAMMMAKQGPNSSAPLSIPEQINNLTGGGMMANQVRSNMGSQIPGGQ